MDRTEFDEASRIWRTTPIPDRKWSEWKAYQACYQRYEKEREKQRNKLNQMGCLVSEEWRQIWEEDSEFVASQWKKWFDETTGLMYQDWCVQVTLKEARKN